MRKDEYFDKDKFGHCIAMFEDLVGISGCTEKESLKARKGYPMKGVKVEMRLVADADVMEALKLNAGGSLEAVLESVDGLDVFEWKGKRYWLYRWTKMPTLYCFNTLHWTLKKLVDEVLEAKLGEVLFIYLDRETGLARDVYGNMGDMTVDGTPTFNGARDVYGRKIASRLYGLEENAGRRALRSVSGAVVTGADQATGTAAAEGEAAGPAAKGHARADG